MLSASLWAMTSFLPVTGKLGRRDRLSRAPRGRRRRCPASRSACRAAARRPNAGRCPSRRPACGRGGRSGAGPGAAGGRGAARALARRRRVPAAARRRPQRGGAAARPRRGQERRDVLARGAEDGDRVADLGLAALGDEDLQQRALGGGLVVHGGLVGLHLAEHVAGLDLRRLPSSASGRWCPRPWWATGRSSGSSQPWASSYRYRARLTACTIFPTRGLDGELQRVVVGHGHIFARTRARPGRPAVEAVRRDAARPRASPRWRTGQDSSTTTHAARSCGPSRRGSPRPGAAGVRRSRTSASMPSLASSSAASRAACARACRR